MPARSDADATRERDEVDTGVLHAGGASLTWAIDESSLFCRDFEGDPGSYAALVDAANAIAVGRFAAVLVTRLRHDDARIAPLRKAGFIDDGEPLEDFLTLVRDVR